MLRFLVSLIFFLVPICSQANQKTSETPEKTHKICLNMIVKNESRVIQRCLDSVKQVIDYWVIVDTGSTDGTQNIIKTHLQDIPGELHQSTWKNWAVNRNEALKLAQGKGTHILFMDADDVLVFESKLKFPQLTHDLYNMVRGSNGFTYLKPQLIKSGLPWKWVGVTHENLDCDIPYSSSTLQGVKYVTLDDGASAHDPKKFQKNIDLLKEGLKTEPNNSRYVFYLAESYRAAGEKGTAIEYYQQRVNMGGWQEEVFWSKLQIALMLHTIGLPNTIVIEGYLNAHTYRPHRVEPIYYLAEFYNKQENYSKAYELIKQFERIAQPANKDILFNMDWMHEYGLLCQLSICSFYIGKYEESLTAIDQLLNIERLPLSWREQSKLNRAFSLAKLQALKDQNLSAKKN